MSEVMEQRIRQALKSNQRGVYCTMVRNLLREVLEETAKGVCHRLTADEERSGIFACGTCIVCVARKATAGE